MKHGQAMSWWIGIAIVVCLGLTVPVLAQDGVGIVPDLTGLSIPAAAAALNRAGLPLGVETAVAWSADVAGAPATILSQSAPPGETLAAGAAVDFTVARALNVVLIYDASKLTILNRSGAELDLTGLMFNNVDGSPAAFAARRWGATLNPDNCVQMWSVGRNSPENLDECAAIQKWLWTGIDGEHFWTGDNGATQFNVVQNGVERGVCQVGAGRCELYLPVGQIDDVTGFLTFSYAADRLVVWNNTPDRWMPLGGVVLNNYAIEGGPYTLGLDDPTLYGRNLSPVATLSRLAPGQCILFTAASPEVSAPPESCDVIASLAIDPALIFWAADFGVISPVDGQERTCPAASPDGLRLCILPG